MEELLLHGANAPLVSVLIGLSMVLTLIFPSLTNTKLGKQLYPVIMIVLGILGGFVFVTPPPIDQIVVGLLSGVAAVLIILGWVDRSKLKFGKKEEPKTESENDLI